MRSPVELLNLMSFHEKIECIEGLSMIGFKYRIDTQDVSDGNCMWSYKLKDGEVVTQGAPRYSSIEKTCIDMLLSILCLVKDEMPDMYERIERRYCGK